MVLRLVRFGSPGVLPSPDPVGTYLPINCFAGGSELRRMLTALTLYSLHGVVKTEIPVSKETQQKYL
jgi:hypothetical protein